MTQQIHRNLIWCSTKYVADDMAMTYRRDETDETYLSNKEIHDACCHGNGKGRGEEGEEPGGGVVAGSKRLGGEVGVQLG